MSNTDYLLTLPVYVDWKKASDSKAVIFRRGYATERQKGLLIIEKPDYLQSKLLQALFFTVSQTLGKISVWFAQMEKVGKDLTAGTIGGAAQLIVGHPFNTIKVKFQSQPVHPSGQLPRYSGAIDAVKQTLAAEETRGLYKGMGAPLATVATLNAVLFTVRGQMEALLRSEPGAPLTVNQQVVAGDGAGVAVAVLATQTELVKCRNVSIVNYWPVETSRRRPRFAGG